MTCREGRVTLVDELFLRRTWAPAVTPGDQKIIAIAHMVQVNDAQGF